MFLQYSTVEAGPGRTGACCCYVQIVKWSQFYIASDFKSTSSYQKLYVGALWTGVLLWVLRSYWFRLWRWESSGIYRSVVSLEYTDVSEVLTASIITLKMEAVRTSETSVYSNETTRRYISEESHLHTRLRENLKSERLCLNVFIYDLFNDAFLVIWVYSIEWRGDKWKMNSKGCGRKRSWPNLRCYFDIFFWGTEKNHETLNQDVRSPGLNLNQDSPNTKQEC
jgi:hypothetical protein